ncbi:MAG TPA: 2,3-bisphosphoglycerate-independent phosphoglycerate mutase [Candidatus Paceibacterota bacterium]|nr:2,3-bisphosphoglycerate-independent phosphoglycerate mutase [Candidatus Paceibacterota bacterium]
MNENKTGRRIAGPVVLMVLDGWGYREDTKDNAIAGARKPVFDRLWREYPHALLKASGEAVGLPEGQMGNSEVGHMTIGAGRPVDTDLVRIDKAISSGDFEKNPTFLAIFDHVKKHGSVLHVQGLVSPGGVHSHQNHLYAFLHLAKKNAVPKVAIHVFTDGRDTAPQSASAYMKELESVLEILNADSDPKNPAFFIATISGRYFAMDRDQNWDRLAKTEQAMFDCEGNVCEIKPSAYLEEQYQKGKSDELLEPAVCATPLGLGCAIEKNDAVFFFNFRADRARMLSEKMLTRPDLPNILFATMTEYRADFSSLIAFPPFEPRATLGGEIARADMKQCHVAETEKFAHVTYFFNCGRETPYEGEKDILLKSRTDIKTHDEAPEMQAKGIADAVIAEIEKGECDFILLNFANADMVGHTANVPATIEAVEVVDRELGRIMEALEKKGGVALVTADHGNAEVNVDPATGIRHTAHTTALVPFVVTVSGEIAHVGGVKGDARAGGLADVAPTVLSLLGLEIPNEMTGRPLI